MRVWFSKIHCPSFICFFCKPPEHLYAPPHPAPFKLDTNAHTLPTGSTAVVASDHLAVKKEEVVDDNGEVEVGNNELILKSCVKRKVAIEDQGDGRKKNVKWMDVAGKDLVDVREFETSESEDMDSDIETNRRCICAIL